MSEESSNPILKAVKRLPAQVAFAIPDMIQEIGKLIGVREKTAPNLSDVINEKIGAPSPPENIKEAVSELVANLVAPSGLMKGGVGLAGVIAHHASPYKFEKFLLDKIGSGQGAQSYGKGLYFAEHPAVLSTYEKEMVAKAEAAIGTVQGKIDVQKVIFNNKNLPAEKRTDAAKQLKELEAELENTKNKFKPTSYTVDLQDEAVAKMLDWDKPLSQQKEALETLKITPKGLHSIKLIGGGDSVEALLNAIATTTAKAGTTDLDLTKAAKLLNDKGIPGIKYLDARSRSVGEGTSNFVVFNEDIIKILSTKEIK